MRKVLFAVLFAVAVAWAGYVANSCLQSWPHMSLDLSHLDPGTQAAHGQAVTSHVLLHLVAGSIPFLAVFGLWWWSRGRN